MEPVERSMRVFLGTDSLAAQELGSEKRRRRLYEKLLRV